MTANSKRAIDAVLFDFGGVFTGSPFKFIEKAGTEMGAKPGQISSIMFGPFDEDTNHHPWHRLERAEITLDLQANVNAAINIGIHGILVEEDMPSTIHELDDILKG